jgi:ubiquinone/menaquinone biosynthesis C-methylase UbiE
MLPRVLEPEVMDSPAEARDYDAMDHAEVNRVLVADFLRFYPEVKTVLDVGTGTAQIPIELCRQNHHLRVVGVDLAEHMLALGRLHVNRASLDGRITLQRVDAKSLPWPADSFDAVISNSIVHHIPDPITALAEIVRVTVPEGAIFVRDLIRPASDAEVRRLVNLYSVGADAHQRQMFGDSLRAALTLNEIRALVSALDYDSASVQASSDRHWTWTAFKT